MIVDDTNSITNHKRYQTREICATVRTMSQEDKQRFLDSIQCRKGACILTAQTYNQKTYNYVESLLNGKRPKT